MKLYLVRHGEYQTNDIEAGLSQNGIGEIEQLGHFLQKLHLTVAKIYHSNKRRAQQTAEILSKNFIFDQTIQLHPGLNPNDEVLRVIEEVNTWQGDVVLVSHLPFLGRLAGKLIVGNENKEVVDFQTGTIACLEQIEREKWLVKWILSPALLKFV